MFRDDLSIIDGASAVLSIGGGKAYSVRSSKFTNLTMLTPKTTYSLDRSRQSDFNSTNHSSPKSVRNSVKSKVFA